MREAAFERLDSSYSDSEDMASEATPPGLTLIVSEAEVAMTSWQHREQHGLCYRDECVERYGKPFLMGLHLPFTPHG